jgi:hypothetical protein
VGVTNPPPPQHTHHLTPPPQGLEDDPKRIYQATPASLAGRRFELPATAMRVSSLYRSRTNSEGGPDAAPSPARCSLLPRTACAAACAGAPGCCTHALAPLTPTPAHELDRAASKHADLPCVGLIRHIRSRRPYRAAEVDRAMKTRPRNECCLARKRTWQEPFLCRRWSCGASLAGIAGAPFAKRCRPFPPRGIWSMKCDCGKPGRRLCRGLFEMVGTASRQLLEPISLLRPSAVRRTSLEMPSVGSERGSSITLADLESGRR